LNPVAALCGAQQKQSIEMKGGAWGGERRREAGGD